MKIQDIVFLIVFFSVIARFDKRVAGSIGIVCLVLAIPLFEIQVFFTAQRLVLYAFTFFCLAAIVSSVQFVINKKDDKAR